MPYTSGTFTPLYNWSNEAASGNPIDPTKFTAEDNDIATGLSACILKDGSQTITADTPWNGHKITGLGSPSASGDAATKGYVDAVTTSGTFTGTLTGVSGTVTGGINYRTAGNLVALFLETALSGTSNSQVMTITGIPSALRPSAVTKSVTVPGVLDNGTAYVGTASIDTSGAITFFLETVSGSKLLAFTSNSFTASGTKGLSGGSCIVYCNA